MKNSQSNNLTAILIFYSILSILGMYFIEQVLNLFIAYKALIKILLFVIIPALIIGKYNSFELINYKNRNKKKITWILTILVFVVIIGTYLILANTINLDEISSELNRQIGLNIIIFPLVALYVILVNSFVEEFFFRGILFFHTFKNRKSKYIFNSLLFSILHLGIFITWFTWYNFLLALLSLFIGGLIFSYVNENNKSIINSWIIHASADLAIIVIGIKMLYF